MLRKQLRTVYKEWSSILVVERGSNYTSPYEMFQSATDLERFFVRAQYRVEWRAFLSTVMNIRIHKESRLLFDKLSYYLLFKEYLAPWSKEVSK
jgi:hypothetical protein